MRNYQKSICILLIILLYLTKGYGQATLRFQQLNMDNGLVNGSINSFLQDYKGAIWIATDNGLTKFNGYKTKHFQVNTEDKSSINGKSVNTIFETKKKELLIATNEAINVFNTNTEIFRPIKILDLKNYRVYSQISDSIILVEAGLKLFQLNIITSGHKELTSIAYLNWKNLLTKTPTPGNYSETYRKNLFSFMQKHSEVYTKHLDYLHKASINDILLDETNGITYFGTNTGLKIYDHQTNLFKQATSDTLRIKSLVKLKDKLVLGTAYAGLWIWNLTTSNIVKSNIATNNNSCIACNYIHTLYIDDNNTLWIGCLNNGVSYVNLNTKTFEQFSLTNNPLENISVRSIHQFEDKYWINTSINSQLITDKKFNILKSIPLTDIGDSVSVYSNVFTFLNLSNYKNYLATAVGLYKYSNAGFTKLAMPDSFTAKQKIMQHITALDSNRLLIATRGGLLECNTNNNKIELCKELGIAKSVRFTYLDANKNLYVFMPSNGIQIFKLQNAKYTKVAQLLAKVDVHDFTMVKNEMWLATSIGVVQLNTTNNAIKIYNTKSGVPNYELESITKSSNNIGFWLGTNHGLFLYNPYTGITNNFDLHDGLPSMQFSSKGKLILENGSIIFATANGLCAIDSNTNIELKSNLPVLMDELVFNDKAIHFNEIQTQENNFTVPFKYNTFTCTLLQYAFYNKHKKFKYKLAGYDKNWIDAESPVSIRYANLKNGKYQLLMQDLEINNQKIITLANFTIKAPWYKHILAYIFYFLNCTYLLYALANYFINKKLKKSNEITKQQNLIFADRERISKDLHDEIGSTLSSIYLFSQVAKTQQDPVKTEKLLSTIEEQSKTLINQMDDIIWSLKSNDEFTQSLSLRLANFSLQYLTPLNINFTYSIDASLEKNITDAEIRKNIILIIREALNNVMKYSKCNEAFVSLQNTTNGITLTITDNGIGFIEANVKVGNGLSNIKKRVQSLNGNCQIIANNAKGTAVICTFPKNIIQTTT